jgi:uncharacterized protein (DUF58 family)
VGKHLNRAKAHFGTDTRGMLEGGRYALLHTRSLEFDDLRPYVPGDDVRDIDWKASARSGSVLIKRFVSEMHHKILLIADTGRNMSALTPSGESKRDVAAHILGAIGLITVGRSDQIGMVYGDSRGSANIRQRRGETHIESMLHRFYSQTLTDQGRSDIACQLDYAATHYRHPMLIVVVSDEPDVDGHLDDIVARLTARHELMWAMISDMPAVSAADGHQDGYDVATGSFVLNAASLGPRVIAAYRRAEQARTRRLAEFMTANAIPHTTIGGSGEIRLRLVELTEVFARAG